MISSGSIVGMHASLLLLLTWRWAAPEPEPLAPPVRLQWEAPPACPDLVAVQKLTSEPAAPPHIDASEPITATTDASDAGEPTTTAAPRRRPRPAAILDADTLREEGVLLSQARDALARGEWARVLTHVEQHRRAHPQGALLEERLVLEAAAACESGDRPRGQAALRALRRRFPGSLALSRVAAVCAGEADE